MNEREYRALKYIFFGAATFFLLLGLMLFHLTMVEKVQNNRDDAIYRANRRARLLQFMTPSEAASSEKVRDDLEKDKSREEVLKLRAFLDR